jgi:hypothetical protein
MEGEDVVFPATSPPNLELTHSSVRWAPGALSLGIKRPWFEAVFLPPSGADTSS